MIKEFAESKTLVSCSDFPYGNLPYENFNSIQSQLFNFYKESSNSIIATKTGSGKTVCAEMILAHEINERGGKGVFLGPLKALTQQKITEWQDDNHHFKGKKISICTGDHRLTADRYEELNDADIIVMTSEMLNSRLRNHKSKHNQWMKQIGTVVIDEFHSLVVEGRGDHLECGIMKFAEINPKGRIVGLSATMPNVSEIGEWLSTLNGMNTNVIISNFRPCPLQIWYEKYDDSGYYHEQQDEKIYTALSIVGQYENDKIIIFTHSKATGFKMIESLKLSNIDCEYHYGDLNFQERQRIEKRFTDLDDLKVIVATPTLAWGVDMPARRVIILGVHRGIDEVETYNIEQEIGRAGRPKYGNRGDAYILVPASDAEAQIKRVSTPAKIISQMCTPKVLAFHIVSEINQGTISTKDDIYEWYSRTLAAFQSQELDEDIIENVLLGLQRCGAIRIVNDKYKITPLGKVSVMFYYSPFDISNLKRNFDVLFDNNKEGNDWWISVALGNLHSNYFNTANKEEKKELFDYSVKIDKSNLSNAFSSDKFPDGIVKSSYCYHCMLIGKHPKKLYGYVNQLKNDIPRTLELLNAIDNIVSKWKKKEYFNKLSARMKYGVSWDLAGVIGISGIGNVKANKLVSGGLKSVREVAKNKDQVKSILKCSDTIADKIVESAKELF